MTSSEQTKNKGILKTTSIIGGSTLIKTLLDMARVKLVAILLGPSGVGLLSVFMSIIQIASTFAGMGVETSGVRQVADADKEIDKVRLFYVFKALQLITFVNGLLGLIIMAIGSHYWSKLAFGNDDYATWIIWLGLAVFFSSIMVGTRAFIQGCRQIAALSKMTIYGALYSLVSSIPLYYFFGEKGIVPSLVFSTLMLAITAIWYRLKIPLKVEFFSWEKVYREIKKILSFGLPLMLSAIVTTGSFFIIRAILVRLQGMDDVGIYHAAYSLAGLLVHFVLQAMGADYYPRLTAISSDNEALSDEVNRQTEVGLLLSMPGIMMLIICSPIIISIFYSNNFVEAIDVLRWMALGAFGRVVSWPLGYVILAKGRGGLFLLIEFFIHSLHVLLLYVFVTYFGIVGSGMAFSMMYLIYTILILFIVYYLFNIMWTLHNIRVIASLAVVTSLTWSSVFALNTHFKWVVSFMFLLGTVAYCYRRLTVMTGLSFDSIKNKLLQ